MFFIFSKYFDRHFNLTTKDYNEYAGYKIILAWFHAATFLNFLQLCYCSLLLARASGYPLLGISSLPAYKTIRDNRGDPPQPIDDTLRRGVYIRFLI